jgi:hypothetical protein
VFEGLWRWQTLYSVSILIRYEPVHRGQREVLLAIQAFSAGVDPIRDDMGDAKRHIASFDVGKQWRLEVHPP